jgi:hypothetical protein
MGVLQPTSLLAPGQRLKITRARNAQEAYLLMRENISIFALARLRLFDDGDLPWPG